MKSKIVYTTFFLLTAFSGSLFAQSNKTTVQGKVISFEESFALEGVSVKVKGTQYSTGTQTDGTFSLDIANAQQVLVFEFPQYETQEVTVGDKRDLEVILKRKNETAQQLSTGTANTATVSTGH